MEQVSFNKKQFACLCMKLSEINVAFVSCQANSSFKMLLLLNEAGSISFFIIRVFDFMQ